MNVLLHIYASYVWPVDRNPVVLPKMNGRANGHMRGDSQRLRDAEEFELEGLMSDDEDGAGRRPSIATARRKESGTPA